MVTPAPRWTRLAHDERRAQILAAAQRLFSARHYGAVSTTAVAREAGVARGLLHHYFGTKRDLYLEVVRTMVRLPRPLSDKERRGRDREQLLSENVDRWLEMVWRNRATWMATVGGRGLGHDPEVEAILEAAREGTADRVIELLRPGDPADAPLELRALVRGYGGLAEAISLEWLQRRRLSREQAHDLLLHSLLQLEREVLPRLGRPPAATTSNRKRRRTG